VLGVQREAWVELRPIWKLEAALKCRSVHMIKLTVARETTPYKWVHPDDD
jgi:hypothetical protein